MLQDYTIRGNLNLDIPEVCFASQKSMTNDTDKWQWNPMRSSHWPPRSGVIPINPFSPGGPSAVAWLLHTIGNNGNIQFDYIKFKSYFWLNSYELSLSDSIIHVFLKEHVHTVCYRFRDSGMNWLNMNRMVLCRYPFPLIWCGWHHCWITRDVKRRETARFW